MPHTRIARKRFRVDDLFSDVSDSSITEVDTDWLTRQARWIRDDLDPMISRHGPAWLQPDQVIEIFKFLDHLRRAKVTVESIRSSRIHLAVAWIVGTATRWPKSVLEVADKLLRSWTLRYGPLSEIGLVLYDVGGRLHGVCQPSDLSKEMLEVRWHKAAGSRTGDGHARKHGALGFTPGDWWINSMFAYHDGIVDSGVPTSHIICDNRAAYAIVLNEWDELDSHDPDHFTYAAKSHESGRFRLTAGTPDSRQPMRVLRNHSLRSFWSPQAGLRYDGLYSVSGWSVKQDIRSKAWSYHISFHRLPDQRPMSEVLRHPLAHELDDYTEYKRIRQLQRLRQNENKVTGPVKASSPAMKRANAPAMKFEENTTVRESSGGHVSRSKPAFAIELPLSPVMPKLALATIDDPTTSSGAKDIPGSRQRGAPATRKPSPRRSPLHGIMTHFSTLVPLKSPAHSKRKSNPSKGKDGEKADDYFSILPMATPVDLTDRGVARGGGDYFAFHRPTT